MKLRLITLFVISVQCNTIQNYASETNSIQSNNSIIQLQYNDNKKLTILEDCIDYLSKPFDTLKIQKLSTNERDNLEKFNTLVNKLFIDTKNINNEDNHYDNITLENSISSNNSITNNNLIEDNNSINNDDVISNNSSNNYTKLSDNDENNCSEKQNFKELVIQLFCSKQNDKEILIKLIKEILNTYSNSELCNIINSLNNNKYIPYIINIIHVNFYNTVIIYLTEYISEHNEIFANNVESVVSFFTDKYSNEQYIPDNVIPDSFRKSYIERSILQYNEDFENANDQANNTDLFDIKNIVFQSIENYKVINTSYIKYLQKFAETSNKFKLNTNSEYFYENMLYITSLIQNGYITNPSIISYLSTKFNQFNKFHMGK